jgi:hypothetical protein
MLSLYLPQSFWTGFGQEVKTSAVTKTGKEGNAWNVAVY